MPFKQKARKNKEGSSSSAPARKDLATRYKAPFPIYTMEEGERYTRLAKCTFTGPKQVKKMREFLDPAFVPPSKFATKKNAHIASAPRSCARNLHPEKLVASATFTYAIATSRSECQKQLYQKTRAHLPSARAQESIFERQKACQRNTRVGTSFSSENHIFPCKGRDSSQEKSPQAPLGQPITTNTTITLLLYK
ncbi:hypothetical protein JCGZ_11286 [Jatropha curcas]|uniref:Uncharacterized protein n=1 Tax=Jatropha curcas TaxID=180498 RepID=A0A067KR54_JATCU|nr:hypothetical protein JCGZ_11286 [Jatropha curcas]